MDGAADAGVVGPVPWRPQTEFPEVRVLFPIRDAEDAEEEVHRRAQGQEGENATDGHRQGGERAEDEQKEAGVLGA